MVVSCGRVLWSVGLVSSLVVWLVDVGWLWMAVIVLVVGMLLIAWMTLSKTDRWPELLANYSSPFHPLLVIVVGPSLMVLLGWAISSSRNSRAAA